MRTIDVMVHDVVTVHPDTDGCGSNRGTDFGSRNVTVSAGVARRKRAWGVARSR
jgi:hypothetical protein